MRKPCPRLDTCKTVGFLGNIFRWLFRIVNPNAALHIYEEIGPDSIERSSSYIFQQQMIEVRKTEVFSKASFLGAVYKGYDLGRRLLAHSCFCLFF